MTRARELRELGDDELEARLADARQELFNLRFQHVTGQLDNYARLGELRKDIARMHTLLRDREIAAAEAQEATAAAMREAAEHARLERRAAHRRGVVGGASQEASDAEAGRTRRRERRRG
jgi:large subunit ribosomal protein L29